ncbi:MAG: CAP domain-containing protein, partial [Hyphomicrobium sp.]|nr:CAP domain-containing protein [Hyphomicrobium sp.]
MYRVALCATAAVALAACSLGSGTISSGYNEPDTTASITSSPRAESVALGGEPSAERKAPAVAGQQYAKLDDQAPRGSYEKAPTGALSDRDYSHTALDPEKARDIINQYRKDKGLKALKLNAELTEAAKA